MTKRHEEWLARAENDLQFARVGLKEGFYAQVCNLSQQTIEKSLKGGMVALNRRYPKTHNLRELAHLLPELKLEKWMEPLTVIDGYYIPTRYPDAVAGSKSSGEPNKEEACEAIQTAEEIWSHVSEFIRKPP